MIIVNHIPYIKRAERLISHQSWTHAGLRPCSVLTDIYDYFPSRIADNSTCRVGMNGKFVEKSIGDVWNSVEDLCQKYICEMGPNGQALQKSFREYCLHSCNNVRSANCGLSWTRNNCFLFPCNRITIWCRRKVNVVANVWNDAVQWTMKRMQLVRCGKVTISAHSTNAVAPLK